MAKCRLAWLIDLGLLALLFLALRWTAAVEARSPTAAYLDVVVNEVAWMGTTVSANDEWLELHNNTAAPLTLTGWTLTAADGTPAVTLTGIIPAQGYFLLERTDDTTVPGVPADQIYTGALGDAGEDLMLRDATAAVIDRVNCAGGWFAGQGAGRVPMGRVNPTADGSQASNWTYTPRCGTATNSAGISRTCVLTTTQVGRSLTYTLYFNERATTATTTTLSHTVKEDALLALLNGAQTRIEAAVYDLDRQSVIDALVAAHQRGVAVRVVGDDEAASGESAAGYQALRTAGITVITDTSLSQIQHNKFLVVDGQIVWTGSTNLSDTGLTLNAENTIVITDTTLAGIYTTEFEEMWAGHFHSGKTDNTAHLLNYNGTLVESYFSPTDLVAFAVWDKLQQAEQSIHFALFFWTDEVLTRRTIERLGAGVQVYGVWDQLGAANVASADEALCAAGAHIKIENFAGKVHHKFAVIDVEGNDPVVILGSYNWTASGAYDNDENTLIIHDRALARVYYAEWLRLWTAIDATRLCNPVAPTALALTGPTSGVTGITYPFTATVDEVATPPFTYTWQTGGQPPQTHVRTTLTDTASWAWSALGPQVLTVTVSNTAGQITATHTITLSPAPLMPLQSLTLTGPVTGYVASPYSFTVTVGPADAALPITYTWQAAGQPTVVHVTPALVDSVTFTWSAAGTHSVLVIASNAVSTLSATQVITLTRFSIYLPLVLRSWPPFPYVPVLNSIDNPTNGNSYVVSWTESPARRADTYTLQEATNANFSTGLREVCTTDQPACSINSQPTGTYYYRVRGQNTWGTSGWSNPQSTTVLPPPTADLRITVLSGASTPEYVAIQNVGTAAQVMTGWYLVSVVGPQTFYFPAGYTLAPAATVRIESYTGAHSDPPAILLWTTAAIWNNSGDQAQLVNSSGSVVSSACYGSGCP